ncbi:glycosyltransferase [Flavobacterium sp.]|uniref:glycosyltransferase family 2 protein n=1 Tax=Flavobacterium sp. TaxID=239 RepID=UPI0024898DAE|nr:glycosyltransferase [Flavobacterium sp.]MDI1318548.1 glycosyltransferase [Flavobacterium sp.]
MTIKLSIIIPAYKVDGYIEKCIRSLQNQDMPTEDYEIIVTNDGSPDRCKEIVESLQNEFSNIILINQENQGVSMARNNAIAIAKGEYILPIDPDDYVVPNVLQSVYQNAISRNLDVLYLAFEIFDKEGKSIWETDFSSNDETVFNGVEGYFAPRGLTVRDPDRSWAMLYRRKMLKENAINYPKNVPYLEDGLFIGKVFTVANRVGFLSAKFYQRTTRIGSATNSRLFFTENAINGFVIAIKDVKSFAKQNNLTSEQQNLVNHLVAKFILLAITPSILKFNFKEYYIVLKVLKKENIDKVEVEGLRFSYKKHMIFFNSSKLLFPFYFRLKNS